MARLLLYTAAHATGFHGRVWNSVGIDYGAIWQEIGHAGRALLMIPAMYNNIVVIYKVR